MSDQHTNVVPCGKCAICLKRRQNAWAFRLSEEMKISTSACFITLTYEQAPLSFNGHQTLNKIDYQKFMKRLRKSIGKTRLKYYACGEYGSDSLRPHYHAVMFNLPHRWIIDDRKLTNVWDLGHVDIQPCTMTRIKYVTKYVMKGRFEPLTDCDDRLPEFSMMSKKLGINHLTPQMQRYYKENLVSHVTLDGGAITALPRYFRDKIFTKKEKEIMSEAAAAEREKIFIEQHKESFKRELEWKKDQQRKHDLAVLLDRKSV